MKKQTDPRRVAMTFRVPSWIYERLSWNASINNRTINAEVLDRLEKSFEDTPKVLPSLHLTGIYEKLKEIDQMLKEHELNFTAANEYISGLEIYIEDGGAKPLRPRSGLEWIDHPETGLGWGAQSATAKEAEAALARATKATEHNLRTAEDRLKLASEHALIGMKRLSELAKMAADATERGDDDELSRVTALIEAASRDPIGEK